MFFAPQKAVFGTQKKDPGKHLSLELGIGQPKNAADEENVHHRLLHRNLRQLRFLKKCSPVNWGMNVLPEALNELRDGTDG